MLIVEKRKSYILLLDANKLHYDKEQCYLSIADFQVNYEAP